ncbi:T9SS type B sorting domain-containing protein [Flavobacterium sp. AS60]|uniref:T9SS type B sorting domain-containing protein n=1 Tax=Flavobacterium anseongense TaxID=2910677 RepID=UPI001F33579C|nr:T9SS type B sorting domain-containing protein [Flavobacterium sp. AS60]MCF6128791.1 T9SS type B sorting domain-containing protein [Flavobacterium sp. AS60]
MKKIKEIEFNFKIIRLVCLLFLCCIPLEFNGQEFEWVYSTKGTDENPGLPRGIVKQIITNSNNDIYIAGWIDGIIDLGDGQTGFVRNTMTSTISFVAKLNESKEVIWVKELRLSSYVINTILLDENENVIISGNATPHATTLFFNSNPPNPLLPNVLNPTHENLNSLKLYGFIYKLDPNGNYIDAKLFNDTSINNIVKDNNNNIIAVGCKVEYSTVIPSEYKQKWGFVTKMNTNLNTIWEKTVNNQSSTSNNGFGYVACDSQNNIYCTGSYADSLVYGSTTLHDDESSQFVSKLSPSGNESWIVEFHEFSVSQIRIDNSDGIYFLANYATPFSVEFNNRLVENLPLVLDNELVLFKINANGNHIWNIPLYGIGEQEVGDFTFNSIGELIIPVKSAMNTEFNFANHTTITTNTANTVILKVAADGELVDYKRVYENTAQNSIYTYAIHTDSDDNIFVGGTFNKTTDFDPHVSNQHILVPELFENFDTGLFFNDFRGFVLKLKNCESIPFFGDTYEFCSGSTPNPTIADIKASGPNISFYDSMTSGTALANNFPLTNGQTYYYENDVDSCANIGRFPLQIIISPQSSPPVVSTQQPCFFQEMQLSNLDINGENLLFYLTDSGGESVSNSLYVNPNTTYYVTQNYNNCESSRVSFSVYQMALLTDNYTAAVCDADKNDTEIVNLSQYVRYFTGSSGGDFLASYFNSHDDALNNQNPISNFANFQATNQTVFIRLFSNASECFEIAELNLTMVYPPEITEIKVNDLAENNTITILPYDGNYSYSLDGINYQSSNHFDNLDSGIYHAYIKDNTANCATVSDQFYVLAYPKYFTPNGDGINDFWRIKMSQFQFSINVEIYDRYGQWITFFDKNSPGWDGKHGGKELPANDYWFKIIRTTDKETIYRGHFSLIR